MLGKGGKRKRNGVRSGKTCKKEVTGLGVWMLPLQLFAGESVAKSISQPQLKLRGAASRGSMTPWTCALVAMPSHTACTGWVVYLFV